MTAIKELRKTKHLTQMELANRLNLPYQSIQRWEKGSAVPLTKHIPLLAKALDVSVETILEIFGGQLEGNTLSVHTQLYELVNELPLISVKQPIQLLEGQNPEELIIKGTYKVLLPLIQLNENHVVIQNNSDAMSPEIKHGAFVLAEKCPQDRWPVLGSGVYAIFHKNGFQIGRIKTNDLVSCQRLQLHSDNDKFGSLTISADDIYRIWMVEVKVQERVS